MKKFIAGLIITVIVYTLPKGIKAKPVSDLILCSENKITDQRFAPYINNGKLKEEPTCNNNYLNIYDWRQCVNATSATIGVKIDEKVSTKKISDLFFDTVFDHCKKPLLFRSISPLSDDVYFSSLLSSATFFYIRGTRYINIGDINFSSEFRKKLLLAYLDFLSNDANVEYPLLHRGNGDPWLKFQKDGKYENPPDVVGIIGSEFAMFANLSDEIKSFSFNELSSFIDFFVYSNKQSSPKKFTPNSLTLDIDEVVFITKNEMSTPPTLSIPIVSITPIISIMTTITSISPLVLISPFAQISIQSPTQNQTLPYSTSIISNRINYQSSQELSTGFNLFLYSTLAFIYLIVIYFAVGINKEFNLFLMIIGFIVGGIVGWQMNSWKMGIVVGVVLSLLFY